MEPGTVRMVSVRVEGEGISVQGQWEPCSWMIGGATTARQFPAVMQAARDKINKEAERADRRGLHVTVERQEEGWEVGVDATWEDVTGPARSPSVTWVVLHGNVFDGMTAYGPFAAYEDACMFAENEVPTEYAITKLTMP